MRFGSGPRLQGLAGGSSGRGLSPLPVIIRTNKLSEVGMLSLVSQRKNLVKCTQPGVSRARVEPAFLTPGPCFSPHYPAFLLGRF